ncbi:DUF3999 family protein [Edaphobacter dinghuensis]|uniref:Uncharacterized protein n=1 Tax=Edaphobacter dinghuensis TaxID=1560005 RepID=A0A917HGR9_9BACT|nr:DUF3999 family protein [Edaphobacter dinghuensis]GGG79006.1 hypothetical protein GCM10011585_22830 [Edaphobacter dinghuensis]
MKSALLALLIFWQAAGVAPKLSPDVRQYSRYERSIALPAGAGQTCAVIDAQMFPHAAPSLKDVRLYQNEQELPYAITLSEPVQVDSAAARILNLGTRGHSIVFDIEMTDRPYTDVDLDLAGQDYLATATVTGFDTLHSSTATQLGEFTLFDLTSQHLSHSTTLHLQESSFHYLHVVLTVTSAPGARDFTVTPAMVRGVTVPPSREAQSLYTIADQTTTIAQQGRQSVAEFSLRERVPVEQVSFVLAPGFKGNFSRDVHISDRQAGTPKSAAETIDGTILRIHLTQAGREIRQQQLSIPAILGANLQGPATVEVAVDNGDDIPLPIAAIRLEMRQRKLCFSAPTAQDVTLFYGDAGLDAPEYDYARLFSAVAHANSAQLGPEQSNPTYRPRPDTRPLTERYPDLLWIALLAVICVLAVVALHSARKVHR